MFEAEASQGRPGVVAATFSPCSSFEAMDIARKFVATWELHRFHFQI
jgi:hypothetical protein